MSTSEVKRVQVPDTLDLVERGKLGINGLMGTIDPDINYEPYFLTFFAARPAYMLHWSSMVSGVQPKYLEALALLKNMTGNQNVPHEEGFINSILDNIRQDGLIYDCADPRRPWNVGLGYGLKEWDEDYTNLAGDGRLLNGMYYYYQLTGDEIWKRQMKRAAEKMLELAVAKNDYAYYPNLGCGNDFSYPRNSGWTHTDEPKGPQEGAEGATTFYQAQPIRGLMKWYALSGDESMLELSGRLARFAMMPKFYGGLVDTDPLYGAERAHWWGHFHGTLAAFRGIIEYASAAGDYRALEFVRDGYEWARHNLCPQLGLDSRIESCAIADYIALGIQLSDAGMGDYWDDADHAVRNALCEAQTTDLEGLKRIGEASAERPINSKWGAPFDGRFSSGIGTNIMPNQECIDNVLERSIGAFSAVLLNGTHQEPTQMHCCTGNGNQAFYFAWEAVVRHVEGTSTINLLYNRFSPWLDIDSYIPYEGKVVIRNKSSKSINIRIPGWVRLSDIRFRVDGNFAKAGWAGRYAVFSGLRGNEEIVVEFPIEKRTVTLPIPALNFRQQHGIVRVTADFKGSTCIGLKRPEASANGAQPVWIETFNRPKFYSDKPLMKEMDYYVAEKPIKWY